MMRGLEKRQIFQDDGDRWDLVERLCRLVPEWGGACFAWAFMDNHVHLVLRTGTLPLARLMRRLNTGFALHFNQRHDRVGYLFQNRFKSRLVVDSEDLRVLLRYVLLNPLRGGLVDDLRGLERYPWCGYTAMLGHRPPFPFESAGRALALFGDDQAQARRSLRSWMSMGVDTPEHEPPNEGELVVAIAPQQAELGAVEPDIARRSQGEISLDTLLAFVCRHFSVSADEMLRGARSDRVSRARAVVAFFAVVRWQIPAKRLSRRLGVSTQAVCQALERGRRIAAEERLSPPREDT